MPKFWDRPNILTLSEQQYFIRDNASQITKRQKMLEIWRAMTPLVAPMPAGDLVPAGTTSVTSGGASPKFWGAKMFDVSRITLFCLEKCLSKHKMTIFSKHFGGAHDFFGLPLATPMLVTPVPGKYEMANSQNISLDIQPGKT